MSEYQNAEPDPDGWLPVTCMGPHNRHDFPLWLAKADTGQVHLWHTKEEMERQEPLWRLATHWKPATDDIPPPPGGLGAVSLRRRSEGAARAYVQGYNAAVRMCRDRLGGIIELK